MRPCCSRRAAPDTHITACPHGSMIRSRTVSGVCSSKRAEGGNTSSDLSSFRSGCKIQANHPVMIAAKDPAVY